MEVISYDANSLTRPSNAVRPDCHFGEVDLTDAYDREADSAGSYDDAILALRCRRLADQLEVAIKALSDIKRFTSDGRYGRKLQLAFTTARDALVALDRNPTQAKQG